MVLCDFEDKSEIESLIPEGNVRLEPSADHATSGRRAVKAVFPEKGGSLYVVPGKADWSPYDYLAMDVFNPLPQAVTLSFQAVDKVAARRKPPFGYWKERFTDSCKVAAGQSTIKFRVSNALSEGVYHDVDLKAIGRFVLSVNGHPRSFALHIDNVRLAPASAFPDTEQVLFDFEEQAGLKDWSNLEVAPTAKASSPAHGDKEHPVKFELSSLNATRGRSSLKLTFSGGTYPTITTAKLPAQDCSEYLTFKADVTASRDCVVVFRVMQDKSSRDRGWNEQTSRWEKAGRLTAGRNEVCDAFPSYAKAVAFEIGMYNPRKGEVLYVDNIRLSKLRPSHATPFRGRNTVTPGLPIPLMPKFDRKWKVLGTNLEVAHPLELADRMKNKWIMPDKPKTIDQVEAEFKSRYEALKKRHPKAVLAILRDGEKGWDPQDPDKVFAGWKDAYMSGHDPTSIFLGDAQTNYGRDEEYEVFLRRRGPLLRVDLSSIPKGSAILAAQLVLTRTSTPQPTPGKADAFGPFKPTFFVAEPCNRPWQEYEMNTFQYAKDKFWKEVNGQDWNGNDPDFSPIIIAHGQSQLLVTAWDFTQAVRMWTEGKRPNHGFTIYSCFEAYMDYMKAYSRECPEIRKRPAMMVVYEPAK